MYYSGTDLGVWHMVERIINSRNDYVMSIGTFAILLEVLKLWMDSLTERGI
jgi:hypothetical protein